MKQDPVTIALAELREDAIKLVNRTNALFDALDGLQKAEAEYRFAHDRFGGGHSDTGRAWDLMRRAGDRARALLNREVTK